MESLPTDCGVDFAALTEVGVLLVNTLGGVDFIDKECFFASRIFSHGKAGRGSTCNVPAVVADGAAVIDVCDVEGVILAGSDVDLVTTAWNDFVAAFDTGSYGGV